MQRFYEPYLLHIVLARLLTLCLKTLLSYEFLGIDLDDVTYTAGLDDATVKALKDIAKTACEEGYNFK